MMTMKTTENDGLVTDYHKNLLSWTNPQVSIVEDGDRPQLELATHQGAVGTWEEDWELSELIEHDQPCFLLYR